MAELKAGTTIAGSVVYHTGNLNMDEYLKLSGGNMSGNIGRTAHNVGHLVGGYNNIGSSGAKTNPIFSIGTSYLPTEDALSNFYGIGYSNSGSATFLSNFTAGTTGWGAYIASDGDARIFLNAQQGDIYATNAMYINNKTVATQEWVSSNIYWNRDGVNGYVYLKTSADKVGIGTNAPSAKLDIDGNLKIGSIGISTSDNVLVHSSGVVGTRTIQDLISSSGYWKRSGTILGPKTQTDGVTIGNVDISTHTQQGALDLLGTLSFIDGNGYINVADNSSGNGYDLSIKAGDSTSSSTGGHIRIYGGAGSGTASVGGRVYIYGASGDSEGNVILSHDGTNAVGYVGVGTISPQVSLDVKGSVRVSDNVVIVDSTIGINTSYDRLELHGLSGSTELDVYVRNNLAIEHTSNITISSPPPGSPVNYKILGFRTDLGSSDIVGYINSNEMGLLPGGGTLNQVLSKDSSTDFDCSWRTAHEVPSGGTTDQVLAKSSATDYDLKWATVSNGVTINNNTNDYVLTATGSANTIQGESSLQIDSTGAVTSNGSFYMKNSSHYNIFYFDGSSSKIGIYTTPYSTFDVGGSFGAKFGGIETSAFTFADAYLYIMDTAQIASRATLPDASNVNRVYILVVYHYTAGTGNWQIQTTSGSGDSIYVDNSTTSSTLWDVPSRNNAVFLIQSTGTNVWRIFTLN